jgi:hypothetical protein
MAETLKFLGQATLTASLATAYTVPGSTTAMVTGFAICNTSTTAGATVEIHLIPLGESSGVKTTVVKHVIPPMDTKDISLGGGTCFLEAGTVIQAKSSVASAVSLNIWGVEIA